MMKLFFFILGFLCFSEGFAQHFLWACDRKLDSLYRVLIIDPESVQKQQEFFDCFPDNFEDFRKTYGYNPKYSKNDSMYDVGEEHVFKGLAQLDKLSDTIYYTRLINLSIGGKWEVDAISALQDIVQRKTEANTQLLFCLLAKYPQEKIYAFWYFYFHSLHPLKEGIPKFLLKMKEKYPGIYQELLKALKNADGQATC